MKPQKDLIETAALWSTNNWLISQGKKPRAKPFPIILSSMRKRWNLAHSQGVIEVFWRKEKPSGIFLFSPTKNPSIRGQKDIYFLTEPNCLEAKDWVLSRLKKHKNKFRRNTFMGSEPEKFWEERLPKIGFYLHSTILIGNTKLALLRRP